jgi:hypothetical protein
MAAAGYYHQEQSAANYLYHSLIEIRDPLKLFFLSLEDDFATHEMPNFSNDNLDTSEKPFVRNFACSKTFVRNFRESKKREIIV